MRKKCLSARYKTNSVKFITIYEFTDISRAKEVRHKQFHVLKKFLIVIPTREFDECPLPARKFCETEIYQSVTKVHKFVTTENKSEFSRFHETENCRIIISLRFVVLLNTIARLN